MKAEIFFLRRSIMACHKGNRLVKHQKSRDRYAVRHIPGLFTDQSVLT